VSTSFNTLDDQGRSFMMLGMVLVKINHRPRYIYSDLYVRQVSFYIRDTFLKNIAQIEHKIPI